LPGPDRPDRLFLPVDDVAAEYLAGISEMRVDLVVRDLAQLP
jgi:hypothetical protein